MPGRRLSGVGVTPRSGVGTAVWHTPEIELGDPPDPESVDPAAETERFESARESAREELDAERDRLADAAGESEAAVFDAHRQFLDDPQITEGVGAAVDDGLPAEHAVERTFDRFITDFEGMDGRPAERADDLRDVRDRLLGLLTDGDRGDLSDLPPGSVVLAERLTPSETAGLGPDDVAGIATADGGRTSHTAIFARSLALPAVVGVGDALFEVSAGSELVVDGADGAVIVDPDETTRATAARDADIEVRDAPVETAEGTPVEVAANVGTRADLRRAADSGADGVGLFRTEFLFADHPPDEDEQFAVYREAAETFPGGRVVIRTLDIGGDKPVEYLDLPDEANPFLGERGIRRSLGPDTDRFETQLRALLRAGGAASGGRLAVLLPMVSTVEEVLDARERLESVANDLDAAGEPYAMPEFGVMIETPAAALLAQELVDHVDFLSLGTNDLAQYVMAAERGNDRVAALADARQPAVLRAIRAAVEATDGTDVWVGICGEVAGDPGVTELLVGLGIDELSMSPVALPRVKQAVSEVSDAAARDLAERALAAVTREGVAAAISGDEL